MPTLQGPATKPSPGVRAKGMLLIHACESGAGEEAQNPNAARLAIVDASRLQAERRECRRLIKLNS